MDLILVKLTYGSAHKGLDSQRHSFHKLLRSLDGTLEKHREAVKHQEGRSHSLALFHVTNLFGFFFFASKNKWDEKYFWDIIIDLIWLIEEGLDSL